MDDIEKRVRRIIECQLNVAPERIVPSASIIDDFAADSLDIVELVLALEDEFEIVINEDDAACLTTVGKIVDFVRSHV